MAFDFSGLVTFRPLRSIGGFTAQVTVEEQHSDRLTITDHPVELGAPVTDHAFKQPARVVIRAGWSASSISSFGDQSYAGQVYASLLSLQAGRAPFDIVTGKRRYANMLMEDLTVTTDAATESILMVTASCREVIIVQTRATSVPPDNVQATPQKTGSVTDRGTIQATPTSKSAVMATVDFLTGN